MYVMINEHTIKEVSSNKIFNKRDALYQEFVDWCNAGNTPTLDNSEIYELLLGKYKGKDCYFCRRSAIGKALMIQNQNADIRRKRGQLIASLCSAVLNYVTGKNDEDNISSSDIDKMLVKHSDIMVALQSNRHNTAKTLIQALTPDQYITQDDIDNVLKIYSKYESKINQLTSI